MNQACPTGRTTAAVVLRGVFRRDIAIAVAIKGALLVALYLVCFSPAHRVRVTPDAAATALMGRTTPEIQP